MSKTVSHKWFVFSTAAATAIALCACGNIANLKNAAEAANAANNNAATASSSASNDSSTSSTGGKLALTEPTTADAGVAKIRVSVLESGCTAAPARRGPPPSRGKNGRKPPQGSEQNRRRMQPPPDGGQNRPQDNAAGDPAKADQTTNSLSDDPGSEKCFMKDLEEDYASGKDLALDAIPEGKYKVVVILEDSAGEPIEQGSADVEIKSGETAAADITLEPVTKKGDGSVAINIVLPEPAKLALALSRPRAAGSCVPLNVMLVDANDHPILATAAISATLASDAATGAFYSDSACSTTVTSVDIGVLHWYATVFYKDTAAGTPTLSATDAAGTLTAASKQATVQ